MATFEQSFSKTLEILKQVFVLKLGYNNNNNNNAFIWGHVQF